MARTIFLSLDEAKQLPNMLGRICPAMLAAHGFYTCTKGGVKTLYVRVPPYETRKALRDATLAVGRGNPEKES